MAKRIGTYRRKSRQQMSRPKKMRGKLQLSRFLQTFVAGDRVVLELNGSQHKGMPFARFQGLPGIIIARKGRCYEVAINDNGKDKQVICAPIHMKKVSA